MTDELRSTRTAASDMGSSAEVRAAALHWAEYCVFRLQGDALVKGLAVVAALVEYSRGASTEDVPESAS